MLKLISSSPLITTLARPGAVVELNVIPAPPLACVSANLAMALLSETLKVPVPPVPSFETVTPAELSSPWPSVRLLS